MGRGSSALQTTHTEVETDRQTDIKTKRQTDTRLRWLVGQLGPEERGRFISRRSGSPVARGSFRPPDQAAAVTDVRINTGEPSGRRDRSPLR